jgi:hypothetical protein
MMLTESLARWIARAALVLALLTESDLHVLLAVSVRTESALRTARSESEYAFAESATAADRWAISSNAIELARASRGVGDSNRSQPSRIPNATTALPSQPALELLLVGADLGFDIETRLPDICLSVLGPHRLISRWVSKA